MATKPQDNGDEFEYVDADSIQYVKRGRKPSLDANIVKMIQGIPVGKGLVIHKLKQDPKSSTYATDKSRIASQIRTAAAAAGAKVRILWHPDGTPQVLR